MKPTFLKVKIKSLMLEAKCIRVEETRAYANRHARKRARRSNTTGWMPANRDLYLQLRAHRTKAVRREARAAQLAYAFIRGVPYRTVEGMTTRKPVDRRKVADLIFRFDPKYDPKYAGYEGLFLDRWLDSGMITPVIAQSAQEGLATD